MKKLILYNGPNSPFGRKTKITALVHKIPFEEKVIKVYFDEISNRKTLYNKKIYWQIMTIISVANGLMEAVLERRMELIRPSNEQSESFVKKQEIRVFRTINWLEKNWNNFEKNISMDQISIAVALEYTKYRFTHSWSNDCTKLNEWLSEFNSNDFMELTIPKEAN